MLNKMASQLWPEKYNSDFAVQITSNIQDSQQFTINFANNNTLRKNPIPTGMITIRSKLTSASKRVP